MTGTHDLASSDGFIPVTGGRVWYRIVGGSAGVPLILLHGGPGVPSHYLEPLAALADERPVIFYDQLGCGRSDRPDDASLWTLERFVLELQQIREALGLREVHLLGHSWGTTLATEHALEHGEGIRSVVLSGPALATRLYRDGLAVLRSRLPVAVRAVLDRHEAAGTLDDPEYQEAVEAFYKRHMSLLPERPPPVKEALAQFGAATYVTMWGPSEFVIDGNLRDYDPRPRLPRLKMPVLLTAGRADLTRPEEAAHYQRLIPGARLRIFEGSAHMTMYEEREAYARTVREFLRDADRTATVP